MRCSLRPQPPVRAPFHGSARALSAAAALAVAAGLGLAVSACADDGGSVPELLPIASPMRSSPAQPASTAVNPRLLRRFVPVRAVMESADNPQTPDKVALGRMLFFDKRLSKDGAVACNSCHKLDAHGVDGEATSRGQGGRRGRRNAPTVYHAAGYFVQFWDGRAADVEAQAKGPILNPIEMGMSDGDEVAGVLRAIPGYVAAFARAFPGEREPVTFDNVGRAIGAFERGLTTPARWDRYLAGERDALTGPEIEGLKLFTNVGCMVCHTGELLGGSSYQRVGAVEPWPSQADRGRFEVTKDPADSMMFKVPTLRNVSATAPYFHDGSAATLPQAVRMMGKHQLGLDLGDAEVAAIVTWLGALEGEIPREYIEEPALPPGPQAAGQAL